MKVLSPLSGLMLICSCAFGQATTWESVYDVIQANCASCHVAGHSSGLELDGTIAETYDALYNVVPANATSAARNYKRVMPGNPYKSFLFSKINNGLALDVTLQPGEGDACPQGAAPLDNKDIELIRQWIIYGAFESDTAVDKELIAEFYDNEGIQSVPSPPAPPAAGEGIQIHFGPFFLWPETEHEYWTKFYTDIPEDLEVKRLDTYMGDYSHHFITYKYWNQGFAVPVEYGLHDGPEFAGIDLVSANQYSDSLKLPQGTAFFWEANAILQLNSHYINYSPDKALACEVYVNVYTQPSGTAIQEMVPVLLSNESFWVPNNGLPYTDVAEAFDNSHGEDQLFIWAMSCHTHKYGEDFNIYKRYVGGERGPIIFDGSCGATNGVPGCLDEIYDYKHPPVRYWPEMLPVKWEEGLIYETTWINDGPESVGFGLTSDDEMMVMVYFYVDDTTGLNLPAQPLAVQEEIPPPSIRIFPNPAHDIVNVFADETQSDNLEIYIVNMTGELVAQPQDVIIAGGNKYYSINVNALPPGIYLVNLYDENGFIQSEEIVID